LNTARFHHAGIEIASSVQTNLMRIALPAESPTSLAPRRATG
jgi:hypothetical protein